MPASKKTAVVYIAVVDLKSSGPGRMPQLVFRAGDRVTARDLASHPEWVSLVRPADEPVPEQMPEPPPARPGPARPGQQRPAQPETPAS